MVATRTAGREGSSIAPDRDSGLTVVPGLPNFWAVLAARLVLFLSACAVAFYLIDPLPAGQVGFDAAASVLYFDRLIQGRHLEAFIAATPKPLLTMVYGVVYHITGDWRPISWLAITIFGLSAVLAATLAGRLGGLRAAVFAGVAVVSSPSLIADVGVSYAVVWAFAACLLAGLAITSTPPRYGWAGAALGVAALARFEVLIILGACAVVLAGASLRARYRGVARPAVRTWLILVGFLAVPIQFAHDWLLTGNPLLAEQVPSRASIGLALMTPAGAIAYIGYHLLEMGPLLVLAALGALVLFRNRQWGILIGLTAMAPGVAGFLVFLAARRIYISGRYLDPIELAIIVAAAVGIGAVGIPDVITAAERVRTRATRLLLQTVSASIVAALLSAPFVLLNKPLLQTLPDNLAIQRDALTALPALRKAMSAIPGVTNWPGPTDGRLPALFVPTLLRPQFAVELGLPISQVSGTAAGGLKTDGTYPVAGQIIFHDQRAEPGPAFDFLEVSAPTTIGRIVITPLLTDPAGGVWVDRIDPAP